MINEAAIFNAVKHNPRRFLDELDRLEAQDSLLNFMRLGWAALEPGVEFVPNYAVEAICDHLQAVTRGEIRRLLINVPPGFSKSMSTNVFWPAWEWGPKALAHYRYISFAHEQNLATRDLVRCRNLVNSEWYQALWGDQFEWQSDQNAKVYYENSQTGWRQACAAESLTGRRGDRIIGDDPHSVKGAESEAQRESMLQTFSETIPTRLNRPSESAIVVIMQRIHERDVSGMIIADELNYTHLMLPLEFEAERRCYSIVKPSYIPNVKRKRVYWNETQKSWQAKQPDAEDFTKGKLKSKLLYPADPRTKDGELLDPVRFPKTAVEELKKALSSWGGTYAVAGQLQQRPAPRGGGMFQKGDFNYIDDIKELKSKPLLTVRGYDLAASDSKDSPYTVGLRMSILRNGIIVIEDVDRYQETPGKMEANIRGCAERDGKKIAIDMPQDPGQAGKVQKTALSRLLHGFNVKFSPESGDKVQRASPLAAQCEAGNVYLVRGDWNSAFINEAALFPNGQFKDQIDAGSRAYAHLVKNSKKKGRPIGAPIVVGG